MRYPADHKAKTRTRILDAAARLFRRRGYHASGVDAVMNEAGLTPGGFYTHFGSKEALLAGALEHAACTMADRVDASLDGLSGRAWAEAFIAYYLSESHRKAVEDGCPLAALASEVAHAGEPVRRTFESLLLRLSDRLADGGLDPGRALAVVVLCIGGLGLARSVDDAELAAGILQSSRDLAGLALDEDRPRD